MMTSNKFSVFLCLVILATSTLYQEKGLLSDHAFGIQAVGSHLQENTNEDPDLCILKPIKVASRVFYHTQYVAYHAAENKHNPQRKSARAPPLVSLSA